MNTLVVIVQHILFLVAAVGLSLHGFDRPLRLFLWTQPVCVGLILRIVWELNQGDQNMHRVYLSVLFFVGYLVICEIAVKKWREKHLSSDK